MTTMSTPAAMTQPTPRPMTGVKRSPKMTANCALAMTHSRGPIFHAFLDDESVRLVGLDFMELRHAPLPLRAAFEAYCVGMWALLSALYLWL